jgi:hypothetical protein
MGRRMRPLDPGDGSAESFAFELRALRAGAGDLPFWKMARRCSISKSALASAVAGYQIPSERVTQEFVRVCGGDWARWRNRRLQAIADLDAKAGDNRSLDTVDRYSLVLAKPRWPVPVEDQCPPRDQFADYSDPDSPIASRSRRPSRSHQWDIAVLAVLVLAFLAGWGMGRSSVPRPVARAASTAQQSPVRAIKDGQDPYVRQCGSDQVPLERQPIYRADGAFYGWVVLYLSPRCAAAWGYVIGPNSPRWTVHIRAVRMSDNMIADFSFRGEARPNSWGNALTTRTGCVRAEAWTDNGPHAVTSCWSSAGPVRPSGLSATSGRGAHDPPQAGAGRWTRATARSETDHLMPCRRPSRDHVPPPGCACGEPVPLE